jgi:predicted small lipoprotein YifL
MPRLPLLLLAALALAGCGQQASSETPPAAPTAAVPWQAPAARWNTSPHSAVYRIDDPERGYTCYVAENWGTGIECFPLPEGAP